MDFKLRNNNNPWHLQPLQQLAISLLIPARRLGLYVNTKRQAHRRKRLQKGKCTWQVLILSKSQKSKARPSVLAIVTKMHAE